MTEASTGRGRIDKRRAILDAAFTVFARRGYAQACVQEIADEAGVAKPTVYNHLNDKETLLRHAVEAAADAIGAQCLEAVGRVTDSGANPEAALRDCAHRLLRICNSDRSHALRGLTYAQLASMPDLADAVQDRTSRRIAEALADRLARLVLAGRLRTGDPVLAAEQFLALLTGPLEARSRLGTRKVPVAELKTVADAAADTFLSAYAAR
ncbi:TetR/AcrR family transcriptional regulator [Nocardia sp. alder85J]|uniref:TetR/AcrR family transcriptional regulator n=1 Tax=Nocardia sp. alder85J TaxID=2862949 RepID=UPI001CD20B76|nr:TetR/AcrR family transcriptional regulator [Nocardia sp. alder85J]MCX4094295.1 TetR/AcrR family transcriptional regulator [Nocardia sp. alder85J]